MTIQSVLQQKNMSMYRLAKVSKVPYATLNDICNGKTQLTKCSAETVYRLARALDVPMEDLLRPYMVKRSSFENFKSTVCHRVKEMGDVEFMMDLLDSDAIRTYYDRHWYPESLYLLALLDYLSRLHDLPQCSDYDDLRRCKLEKPVYPASVLAVSLAAGNDQALQQAEREAIPEFMRFNIVESEMWNVI